MLNNYPPYKFILLFLDFVAFILAAEFAKMVVTRHELFTGLSASYYILLFLFFIFCFLTFQYNQLYHRHVFLTRANQITLILKSVFINFMVLVVFLFFLSHALFFAELRLGVMLWSAFFIVLLVIFRVVLFKNLFAALTKSPIIHQNVLIVGAGESGAEIASSFGKKSGNEKTIVGFVDDFIKKGQSVDHNLPVLGTIQDINHIVETYDIDLIIIAISNITYERLIEIYELCLQTGKNVKVYSDLVSIIAEKVPLEILNGYYFVGFNRMQNALFFRWFKRSFDLVATLLMMILFLPFWFLTAIAIKMSSKGPVFYKQTRIGKNGQSFTFYKFRSMVMNNDNSIHKDYTENFIKNNAAATRVNGKNVYKIQDDPRITEIGKFLRATSLDELPQLINVIKGEMSLVGPRPCMPYEWDNYEEWHKKRLSVTPGCTGLWQVSGRSSVGFNDMVILDLFYVNNMSPWLDLQLLLKTIPVILLAKGAH
jgi:undecaprenyl-phosphate galactose phosphotransferase